MLNFASAGPAPLLLAPWTSHMSTTFSFLSLYIAPWASTHIISQTCPNSKTACTFVMTLTFMPLIPTLETHLLTTCTHRPVLATTGFLYCLLAVRTCAPLDRVVGADLNILLYSKIHLYVFFWAEILHLISTENQFALSIHTLYFEHLRCVDVHSEVFSKTVFTKLMSTQKRKEILLGVCFKADLTLNLHISDFAVLSCMLNSLVIFWGDQLIF